MPLWVTIRVPDAPAVPAWAASGCSAERLRELLRLGRRRDQVDVLAGLGHPARRAGDRHPVAGRVRLERRRQLLGDRQHLGEQDALGRALVAELLERREDVLLDLRAEPLDAADLLADRRLAELVQVGDPELVEHPPRRLRADPGDPRHLDQRRRELLLQLRRRRDLALLEQGDDLRLQGVADPGQVGCLALARRARRPRPGSGGSPAPPPCRRSPGSGRRRRARTASRARSRASAISAFRIAWNLRDRGGPQAAPVAGAQIRKRAARTSGSPARYRPRRRSAP